MSATELLISTTPTVNVFEGPIAYSNDLLWIAVLGFIVAFCLAFGVGANDVANVFGTSVGAKVITLRNACIVASIGEVLGSVLLGYKVSETVRKGILDVSLYIGAEKELMLGCLAALIGSAIWNILASFLRLPVSGTHTIVGASIGFSLVARGLDGVNWKTLGKIVGSWFISPLFSGFCSVVLFIIVRRLILNSTNPQLYGLRSLPLFYGTTIFINVFSIVHDGPSLLYLDNLPIWLSITAAVGIALIVSVVVQLFVVPRLRRQNNNSKKDNDTNNSDSKNDCSTDNKNDDSTDNDIENRIGTANEDNDIENRNDSNHGSELCLEELDCSDVKSDNKVCPLSESNNFDKKSDENSKNDFFNQTESEEIRRIFAPLQILTATFGSFAHGGNDVSNAVGPLVAIWLIFMEGSVAQKSETPLYILFFGGVGISVGLWVWGRRVMKTIGEDLTSITASSGFTIELGAAVTVLFASKIGLPISSTHCKVGSVVFVGWIRSSKSGVDWSLFRNIIIAWLVTVPFAAGTSAAVMAFLRAVAL